MNLKIFLVLLFFSIHTGFADDTLFFDSDGNYEGRLDDMDNLYNDDNMYQGSIHNDIFLDKENNYSGYIEDGNFFDEDGNYEGRVDESGHIFDQNGNYSGKIKGR